MVIIYNFLSLQSKGSASLIRFCYLLAGSRKVALFYSVVVRGDVKKVVVLNSLPLITPGQDKALKLKDCVFTRFEGF